MALVLVGTSGWSYDDWVGPFYPPGLSKERWLHHYAERFPTVEVNFTHYRTPEAQLVRTLAARMLKAGLRHSVWKAPRTFSHEAVPRGDDEAAADEIARFFAALAPVKGAGVLDGVLLQFDPWTAPERVVAAVRTAHEAGPPAPLFVEVRHAGFREPAARDAVRKIVEGSGGCLVATDNPGAVVERAPPARQACFRMHGRSARWFEPAVEGVHGSAKYDFLYSEAQVAELAARVREAEAERVHVFFNNHVRGQAPENATALMERLGVRPRGPPRLEDF